MQSKWCSDVVHRSRICKKWYAC